MCGTVVVFRLRKTNIIMHSSILIVADWTVFVCQCRYNCVGSKFY